MTVVASRGRVFIPVHSLELDVYGPGNALLLGRNEITRSGRLVTIIEQSPLSPAVCKKRSGVTELTLVLLCVTDFPASTRQSTCSNWIERVRDTGRGAALAGVQLAAALSFEASLRPFFG